MLKLSSIGNLTKDGQLKEVGTNQVCNFSIARKDRRTQETTYIDCSIWGQLAISLSPYLTKGTKVYVEGELGQREWVDKDGNKQVSLTCRVRELELIGGGGERGETPPRDPLAGQDKNPASNGEMDDEIPF